MNKLAFLLNPGKFATMDVNAKEAAPIVAEDNFPGDRPAYTRPFPALLTRGDLNAENYALFTGLPVTRGFLNYIVVRIPSVD